MNFICKRILTRIQVSLFPSEHDKEVRRWFADDKDENRRFDYSLDDSSLVMDLGGYKGQWASDIYARYNCRVLVFEPVELFAQEIECRFKKNKHIEVFQYALGAKERKERICLNADGSSVYRSSGKKEYIKFEDVLCFFERRNIENVDLMKINIEGGEFELLPRMIESGLISKVTNIQIQFHNIAPDSEKRMVEIYDELSRTHRPTYQYKFVWDNWTRK